MGSVLNDDARHMRHALVLARRGQGRTGPNPSVGCVIVARNGHVAGRGRTADGGRPHAEAVALAMAGSSAHGATAYVTLEPCATLTQTPSCANSLAEAGVRRVVVGTADPDPRTAGKGIARMRAAGLDVTVGVQGSEARVVHAGFLSRIERGRPFVTLKIAQSLDGRIATRAGESQWITGEAARRHGHLLRARHDAILAGIGTALADDPMLTCRLQGLTGAQPLRVILDSHGRLPLDSKLARSARDIPTIVFTTVTPVPGLTELGVQMEQVEAGADGKPSLSAVLNILAQRGISTVLVEGGGAVHASFLRLGLADAVDLFTAPVLLGGDGTSAVAAMGLDRLSDAPKFTRTWVQKIGGDLLESYRARA